MKLTKTEIARLQKIREKLFKHLSFQDLVYIRMFISKHWYKGLYDILWFDCVPMLKRISI